MKITKQAQFKEISWDEPPRFGLGSHHLKISRKSIKHKQIISPPRHWGFDFLQLRMFFNRFFRVWKQLNGMWHQLHFFSCISGGGDVSTSPPNEIGDAIGGASMIFEESWREVWVWSLALYCWLLFSFLRSSFALAARKVCLITSIFKDLFSRLKKKTWKTCIVFCNH